MTPVEDPPAPPSPTGSTRSGPPGTTLPDLCPYLATPDGAWRSATAIREHRCMAVAPPVQLALEKQRRLCLVAAHAECATYGAAEAERAPARAVVAGTRPIARMTPVILDRGRFDLRMPALRADRASGQAVLVAVLGIALVAIVVSRPSGDAGAANDGANSTPAATAPATTDVASATPTGPTPEPTQAAPSAEPSAPPTTAPAVTPRPPTPVPSAAPVTSGATYKVKSGDTLVAIAARFDTTVAVLVELNGIADPSRLRVGQVLKLP